MDELENDPDTALANDTIIIPDILQRPSAALMLSFCPKVLKFLQQTAQW